LFGPHGCEVETGVEGDHPVSDPALLVYPRQVRAHRLNPSSVTDIDVHNLALPAVTGYSAHLTS
jgi:hypothetical protein